MALTEVSSGGIKDGQVHTADLADGQITVGKLHADALDHTYTLGADGSNHYTFTGEGLTGAVNDPTLYLTRGKTYRFVNVTLLEHIRFVYKQQSMARLVQSTIQESQTTEELVGLQ